MSIQEIGGGGQTITGNYQVPVQGGPVQTQGGAQQVAAAGNDGVSQTSLEERAKEVVTFNVDRLNQMEQTGKLPPPLKMDEANDNFKTVVDYMSKSPEVPQEYKGYMDQDLAKAKELYKNNPDLPFPVHLAQTMGQDQRIPPPLSLSAIDFTRSFAEYAK
jgi:hypothetical protein